LSPTDEPEKMVEGNITATQRQAINIDATRIEVSIADG
jgi:hypothetical protein